MLPLQRAGSTHLTIRQRSIEDRPREKLINKGATVLSDAELLGILIGSGICNKTSVDIAQLILKECDNDLSLLARYSIKDLQKFPGIGAAKAAIIASAFELFHRREKNINKKKPKITKASEVYALLKPELTGKLVEEFWVVLLNRGNHLIKKCQVSRGGFARTTVDPKVVFKHVLEHSAPCAIVAHNHPSNRLEPSEADIGLTHNLVRGAKFLDIQLLDHVICADTGYYSFVEAGIMNPS